MSAEAKSPVKKAEKKNEKVKKSVAESPKPATKPATKPDQDASSSVKTYKIMRVILTALAFITRFYKLYHPSEVVFDEVHFGKFASHYLEHEFFFDVHPPLGKLLFALVGYLIGYSGEFKFEKIGDSYTDNGVPYVMYRALPAALGALTVPLVFGILEHCHFSPYACFIGAALILFDGAFITEERLILLDSSLIFFCLLSIYCYVRFRNQRHAPFSKAWYYWLLATGVALSSVISVKYVGFFSFLMIGSAVCVDLYELLDSRNKPKEQIVSLALFMKHFIARLFALVIFPFLLYLFWFYVHFQVLYKSGPGDSFMSTEFQASLSANKLTAQAYDVHYFDEVTIKASSNNVFLHSHAERYPLQYADGRISSQGQQVTGYSHKDINNIWQIIPADFPEMYNLSGLAIAAESPKVMLKHVSTNTFLRTHDVASPGNPANEEFTTVPYDVAMDERKDDCTFILNVVSGGNLVRTHLTRFRLKHLTTSVSMCMASTKLPDWGFEQFEVNGNKQLDAPGTEFYFDEIESLVDEQEKLQRKTIGADPKIDKKPSFFANYLELQGRMFYTNARLTSTHPYMSSPYTWPLMRRGVSFWSNEDNTEQIYLIGNHVAWYLVNASVLLFVALLFAAQVSTLRVFDLFPRYAENKIYKTLLWFFGGYLFHYLPFFLMGRQLFLHHYLPAQAIGCLLVAGLVDVVLGGADTPNSRFRTSLAQKIIAAVLVLLTLAHYIYFAPLCYGTPMQQNQIAAREWFNIELQKNRVAR